MPLPEVVEKLEDVPEGARGAYVPDADGKHFRLDREDSGDDAAALKRALARATADRKKYEVQLEQFKDFDPERYRQLLEADTAREKEEAEKKGHYEKLLKQREDAWKKDEEKYKGDLAESERELEIQLVDAEVSRLMGTPELKGFADPILAHLKVKHLVKVVKENGRRRVQILDADGDERVNAKTGAPLTLAELLHELRADAVWGRVFEGNGANGSDAAPQSGSRGTARVKSLKDLKSDKEKSEFITAHGLEAFQSLPRE